MSGSVLDRYGGGRTPERPGDAEPSDTDGAENLGAFGWLRGVRDRAVMLELRRKGGDITAIGYAWIERVEYDPSEGITIHALGKEIKIKGRHLNAEARRTVRLFQGITRHRVPWIQEANEPASLAAGDDETVIESIGW